MLLLSFVSQSVGRWFGIVYSNHQKYRPFDKLEVVRALSQSLARSAFSFFFLLSPPPLFPTVQKWGNGRRRTKRTKQAKRTDSSSSTRRPSVHSLAQPLLRERSRFRTSARPERSGRTSPSGWRPKHTRPNEADWRRKKEG